MKNLDIIIFTVIVVFCFITFMVSTFRAFEKIEKEGFDKLGKRGIISRLLAYFESLT
ncbi:hypothetical protein [Flavobacterium sp.]|uniref:hypothetical protein n=1 Tax=Flavobacterium sp. TaxID=239 RepID=UPI00286BAB13|nr:hypothetical protein [Flavobacterium sp.]